MRPSGSRSLQCSDFCRKIGRRTWSKVSIFCVPVQAVFLISFLRLAEVYVSSLLPPRWIQVHRATDIKATPEEVESQIRAFYQ